MIDNNAQAAGSAEPHNDGSLDAAVASMPDFDDSNLVPFERARDSNVEPRRADNGRFTTDPAAPKQTPVQVPDPRIAAEALAAADAAAKAAEEADTSTPADEFFELPPEEEGGEPRRIPATEVFEGYQKAQELAAEIEEVRRSTVPPQEYDRQILETVQARGRIMQELQAYAQMLQPQQPDLELLNQASPRFNPDLYYQQVQMSQQLSQQLGAVRQQMAHHQASATREQEALSHATRAREQGKLRDMWPEVLSDPKKAHEVREKAARFYGIDDTVFASTLDARLYAVLKDALAYRDGVRAQQTAVKVVRAKQVPKLVRASARNGNTAKQQATSSAMQRLSRSGSLDDAADAIGGLLG